MFHDHFDATYEVQTGTSAAQFRQLELVWLMLAGTVLRLFQPTKNAAAGKFLLLRESFLIQ
jgi:hypothetical protein